MYTDSAMTVSYIKLFAMLLILNILWFSAADTRMRWSCTAAINTDVQLVRFKCKILFYRYNLLFKQMFDMSAIVLYNCL